MRSGTVVSYNSKVKVGFIRDENGEKIKFFNANHQFIVVGMNVSFNLSFTSNGLMATSIVKSIKLATEEKFIRLN